jgi:D-galacturonate reductase
MASLPHPVAVLMVGTGEYTTGFGVNSSKTDKGAGVVALTMFDLRKRGLVGELSLAGVNGTKFPDIRKHMSTILTGLYPRSEFDMTCTTYPADDKVDPRAYVAALDALPPGSAVIIFTPDDCHFEQAMEAVKRGHHVLVTKVSDVTFILQPHQIGMLRALKTCSLSSRRWHSTPCLQLLLPSIMFSSLSKFTSGGTRSTLTHAIAFELSGTSPI